jgi:hypothetical protein
LDKITIICAIIVIATIIGFVVYAGYLIINPPWLDHNGYAENPNGLGHLVNGQPHYYAPEANYAGTCGAPNGVYQQKEWGWFDNETRTWHFAMCDYNYLGPLHGGWPVKEEQWVPVLGQESEGVYPIDARLYITLSNNTIVNVQIKSQLVYGN